MIQASNDASAEFDMAFKTQMNLLSGYNIPRKAEAKDELLPENTVADSQVPEPNENETKPPESDTIGLKRHESDGQSSNNTKYDLVKINSDLVTLLEELQNSRTTSSCLDSCYHCRMRLQKKLRSRKQRA